MLIGADLCSSVEKEFYKNRCRLNGSPLKRKSAAVRSLFTVSCAADSHIANGHYCTVFGGCSALPPAGRRRRPARSRLLLFWSECHRRFADGGEKRPPRARTFGAPDVRRLDAHQTPRLAIAASTHQLMLIWFKCGIHIQYFAHCHSVNVTNFLNVSYVLYYKWR